MKEKSLGTMKYPRAEIDSIDCSGRTIVLMISDGKRKLKIVMGMNCPRLLRLHNQIVTAQIDYARCQTALAAQMQDRTKFEEVRP